MRKAEIIVIVISVFIILVLAVMFISYSPSANYENYNTYNSPSQEQYQESEQKSYENCQVEFTEYLIEPKFVQKVGQVGVVHGSGKSIVERSYISLKEEFTGQKVPIYAPTDMTLIQGSHYKNPAAQMNSLPDYALKFDSGCGVEITLGHLKEVVEPIASQLREVKPDSRENQLNRINFKPGDLVGYFIYNPEDVSGFDFVARDKKFINGFINQKRYENGRATNLINGVCPYDFYKGDKKETYYALLGGAGGTLFKIKDCGSASRDVPGTISGMWFLSEEIGNTIYEDYKEGDYGSPISLMGDEESVSIGNLGQTPISRIYSTNPTYKLPAEVTTEHCYQIYPNMNDAQGYAYFKIIDESTINAYYSSTGKCPKSMPEGGKRYYK